MTGSSNLGHNTTTPYGIMGSITHRGEQLYERVVDNNLDFFGEKENKKIS